MVTRLFGMVVASAVLAACGGVESNPDATIVTTHTVSSDVGQAATPDANRDLSAETDLPNAFIGQFVDVIFGYMHRLHEAEELYRHLPLALIYMERVETDYLQEVDRPAVLEKIKQQLASDYPGKTEKIDPKDFAHSIMDGVSEALIDSEYFDYRGKEFPSAIGSAGSVGLVLMAGNKGIRVLEAMDQGTAKQAGISKGDLILAVDDFQLNDASLNDAVEALRGPVGSKLRLEVQKTGKGKTETVELTRIPRKNLSSTSFRMVEGIPVLKLGSIQEQTLSHVKEKLYGSNHHGKPIIIDLRVCGGGLLEGSINIADLFLPKGTFIAGLRGRPGDRNNNRVFQASAGYKTENRLIILTGPMTASGAEIIARSLKHGRDAVVIGKNSYGRGSVQTLLPITRDFMIKLTTALLYDAKGISLSEPLVPDILITEPATDEWDPVMQKALLVAKETEAGQF
ncbi:S41 family peptidase [Aestuariispira insulae]|uniref:Carboxyl-terminal processing protease n=1 Tax=Aestuariispira insulae TaxID=1461337 RepID=A0A3D9HPD6_9PROT|nr:S41 family peptidase [Aestuariispira insulae]RED50756.1 carboxyl-terminal processing protease [Aestuariispira insulae]